MKRPISFRLPAVIDELPPGINDHSDQDIHATMANKIEDICQQQTLALQTCVADTKASIEKLLGMHAEALQHETARLQHENERLRQEVAQLMGRDVVLVSPGSQEVISPDVIDGASSDLKKAFVDDRSIPLEGDFAVPKDFGTVPNERYFCDAEPEPADAARPSRFSKTCASTESIPSFQLSSADDQFTASMPLEPAVSNDSYMPAETEKRRDSYMSAGTDARKNSYSTYSASTASWRIRGDNDERYTLGSASRKGKVVSIALRSSQDERRSKYAPSLLYNMLNRQSTHEQRPSHHEVGLRSLILAQEIVSGLLYEESGDEGDECIFLLSRWGAMLANAVSRQRRVTNTEVNFAEALSADTPQSKRELKPLGFQTLHPACFKRLCWDLCSILLVLYDVVTIPLVIYDIPEPFFIHMFCLIFWTIDIALSSVTGYEVDSRVEMRVKTTLRHYCRTWFMFDLLLVTPAWTMLCMAGGADRSGVQHVGKLANFFRVLRIVRLLRIIRLMRAWRKVRDRFTNEYMLAFLEFGKIVLLVVVLNHYSACFWYGISQMQGDMGWVHVFKLQSSSLEYLYLTSLHWSMSQFHGTMEITPGTPLERSYALISLFFGLVAASIFISSITSLIIQTQKLNQEKFTQKHMLFRYLQENQISPELTLQIKSFVRRATYATTTRSNEVALLKIFPAHLLEQLDVETRIPVTNISVALKQIRKMLPNVAKVLCLEVLKQEAINPGGLLFECTEATGKMFLIWKGKVIYNARQDISGISVSLGSPISRPTTMTTASRPTIHSVSTSMSQDAATVKKTLSTKVRSATARILRQGSLSGSDEDIVQAGNCLSEMNLWSSWHHRGDCMTIGSPTIYSVEAKNLVDLLMVDDNHNCSLAVFMANYAAHYINWLRQHDPETVNDLSVCPQMDSTFSKGNYSSVRDRFSLKGSWS